ncbi:hypothetical protein H5410_021482 [Solanum commersonii]|uniref:Uncharacterized protein n=1 Tax=Solanum commersonii TaxID=4109 RepID=A0A9J5ZBH0_SOLCO|nr:hypothetical protein H5410_021482 [Solanum commersonii]
MWRIYRNRRRHKTLNLSLLGSNLCWEQHTRNSEAIRDSKRDGGYEIMILEDLHTKIRLAGRNNAGKKENASLEEGQVGSFKLKAEAQLCPADKRARAQEGEKAKQKSQGGQSLTSKDNLKRKVQPKHKQI